jgi:ribosomal protein S18 acetylase RimI-like enzyme
MNFYSEDIINNIIDNTPLENILDEIEGFRKIVGYLIHMYSIHDLHYNYTDLLLLDEKVKIAFYCLDFQFDIFNCPTMLMYRKHVNKEKNEINFYILLICTKFRFRGQGYGSKMLDNFIERIKEENKCKSKMKVKIILSSLEEAVLFYEGYGFRWTRESLEEHPMLMRYEKYDEKKEYFILEKIVMEPTTDSIDASL